MDAIDTDIQNALFWYVIAEVANKNNTPLISNHILDHIHTKLKTHWDEFSGHVYREYVEKVGYDIIVIEEPPKFKSIYDNIIREGKHA